MLYYALTRSFQWSPGQTVAPKVYCQEITGGIAEATAFFMKADSFGMLVNLGHERADSLYSVRVVEAAAIRTVTSRQLEAIAKAAQQKADGEAEQEEKAKERAEYDRLKAKFEKEE